MLGRDRCQHLRVRIVEHARVFHAAEEAAGDDHAIRHAVGELSSDPGAGDQAAAIFLGY